LFNSRLKNEKRTFFFRQVSLPVIMAPFLVFCFFILCFTVLAINTSQYQSSRFDLTQLTNDEQTQLQAEREKQVKRMIDRGYAFFIEGNYQGAEIEFENVLNIHSKNRIPQKYYQIASLYYNKSKQMAEELSEFRKNKSPDTKANEIKSKDYYKLGKENYKKKDYEQARLYFEKALILDPTSEKYSKYIKKSSEKLEDAFKKEEVAEVSKKEEKTELKKKKEAEVKAKEEALKRAEEEKKQKEVLAKKIAEEEEKAKDEALKKEKEEKERQEAIAKQKTKNDEEKKKDEALKKEKEEKEKQEKLAKNKAVEEKERQARLAEEKAKAEAKQKAIFEKVEKERVAREKIEKEKEAQLKAEKEAKERAEKEAQLKAEKEAQAKAKLEAKKEAEETLNKKEMERKLAEEKAEKERIAELKRKEKEEADKKAEETLKKKEMEKKLAEEQAEKERIAELKRKEKEEADKKAKLAAEMKAKEEAEKKAKEEAPKVKKIEVAQVKKEPKPEVKKIEPVKDINREKSEAILAEGKRLLDEGRYKEAITKFDESNKLSANREALRLKKIAQNKIEEEQAKAIKEREEEVISKEKQSKELCDEGINLYKNAQYDQAIPKLEEALQLNPKNTIAESYLARAKEEQQRHLEEINKTASQARLETADALFNKGKEEYEKGNIAEARANWEKALTNNPDHKKSATYLAQTEAEYQEFLKKQDIEKEKGKKREEIKAKLKTLITMETHEDTPIQDFMKNLSLISGITFSFSEGVSGKVNGKFEENTLEEVLNAILKPNGLKWSITEGNIVLIEPDLQTKIFQLKTKDQIERVKTLYDNKFIHRLVYGEKAEPPIKGCEITLDEREGILIVVGSQAHIDKLNGLLANLPEKRPLVLETQSFIVSKDKGEYTKTLVENFLKSKADPSTYLEGRKILYEDGTLIIIDTPDNIKLVENLLSDKELLETIKREKLDIRTFKVLTPELMEESPEVAQSFLSNVEEMIRTKLYSVEGQKASAEKGRRLWVNPAFGTITIVDSPENVDAIGTFIATLPTIEKMPLVEIIYLKYQTASEVETKIKDFLGISGAGAVTPTTGGGLSTTMRLSGDSKAKWRDIQIQLIRVNENDVNLDNDETVELFATTPDTEQDVSIQELRSQRVGDYRIRVDDAKATGRGRCTLFVEYLGPQGGIGVGYPTAAPVTAPTQPTAEVPTAELNITSDDTTNSIIVQTADPSLISRIKEIITKVDIPILQAQIEIKFVEVNETRAKELGIEFTAANLSSQSLSNFDDGLGLLRFAQDLDEFLNPYEPFAENLSQTNLLKGTTVLSWITGGSHPLSITLRSLEAEGILNIISGPKITTRNGNDANFTITKTFWYVTSMSATGITWDNQNIDLVDFSVTPTISMEGTISLEISGTVSEFMPGTPTFLPANSSVLASDVAFITPSVWQYQLVEKAIDTEAIIQDGETIVLGGWTSERARESKSGVPVLRHIPYVGPILFGRSQKHLDKTTLLIFLTGYIVKPEER